MAKKLGLLAAVVIFIVVAVFAYAALNANALVAQLKPALEKAASNAIGAPVAIGQISTHIFPRAALEVRELHVGEAGPGRGLGFDRFVLDLELSSLLKKKLDITRLSLSAPKITFVREQDGVTVAGMPKRSQKGDAAPAKPTEAKESTAPQAQEAALAIDLRNIELEDGTVVYDDRVAGTQYSVDQIHLSSGVQKEGDAVVISALSLSGRSFLIPLSFSSPRISHSPAGSEISDGSLNIGSGSLTITGAVDPKGSGKFTFGGRGIELQDLRPLVADRPSIARAR